MSGSPKLTPSSFVLCMATQEKPVDLQALQGHLPQDVRAVHAFVDADGTLDLDTLAENCDLSRVVAAVVRSGSMTKDVFARLQALQIVVSHGSGYGAIDLTVASKRGVWVTNVPRANSRSVAELATWFAIGLVRRFLTRSAGLPPHGHELAEKTLGIVGFGGIGHEVATVSKPLYGTVVASRRSDKPIRIAGVTRLGLNTLLQVSDVVSVHVPSDQSTDSLIDRNRLDSMRDGSFLISTSRSTVVDFEYVLQCLESGHLAGAAFDDVPECFKKSSLEELASSNLLLMPHLGGAAAEAVARIAKIAGQEIARALSGATPEHVVNLLPQGG